MSKVKQVAYEIMARDAAWPVMPVVAARMDTGEIVTLTKHLAEIFGYQSDELLGESVELLVPDALQEIHATWRKDASVPKTRLMGQGRKVMGRRKDGTLFPCHAGLTAAKVTFGEEEHLIGIVFVIDLTGILLGAGSEGHTAH